MAEANNSSGSGASGPCAASRAASRALSEPRSGLDEEGRTLEVHYFDEDDESAARDIGARLFLDTLEPQTRRTAEATLQRAASQVTGEGDHEALFHPEFRLLDERELGYGELDRATHIHTFMGDAEFRDNLNIAANGVLAVGPHGQCNLVRVWNDRIEWEVVWVSLMRDGQMWREYNFDIERLDDALELYVAHNVEMGADPMLGLTLHNRCAEVSAADEVMAVRGERHALVCETGTEGDGTARRFAVVSIDHEGLQTSLTAFDPDDLESAIAELDRVWIEGLRELEADGR